MAETETAPQPKAALRLSWTDKRFRGLIWQVLVVGAVAGLIFWLWRNTVYNLDARRITTGFAFLGREAGMPLADSVIPYKPSDTYLRALGVGVLNTLRVALVGVVLATILGTLIGIARLSKNWLLAKLAAVYVEGIRDLPLLLQIFIWYVLFQLLPPARQSFKPLPGVYLSNRGLFTPTIDWTLAHGLVLLALIAGVAAALVYRRRMIERGLSEGRRYRIWPVALALALIPPVAVDISTGAAWTVSWPQLRGFNFAGGSALSPEYVALLVALTTYTAAFIAEIVRAGILSVAKGQWEASEALGLRRGLTTRLIVLPQALRVVIPPLTSQHLNLIKNSSLAVAIGYQDIVSVANTTLTQTGQAIEAIAIVMLVFLTISLSISALMNWYNARVALVER
jgi:general L-amino acid transport system permease protein